MLRLLMLFLYNFLHVLSGTSALHVFMLSDCRNRIVQFDPRETGETHEPAPNFLILLYSRAYDITGTVCMSCITR